MSSVVGVCLGSPVQYDVYQKEQLVRAIYSDTVNGGLAVAFATYDVENQDWGWVARLVDKESGMVFSFPAAQALQTQALKVDLEQRIEEYMREHDIPYED